MKQRCSRYDRSDVFEHARLFALIQKTSMQLKAANDPHFLYFRHGESRPCLKASNSEPIYPFALAREPVHAFAASQAVPTD